MVIPPARDLFWGSVALATASGWWLAVWEAVASSKTTSFWNSIGALPVALIITFWIGLGAWRRTRWGHTSPRRAAQQFLLLELAGLVVAGAVLSIARLATPNQADERTRSAHSVSVTSICHSRPFVICGGSGFPINRVTPSLEKPNVQLMIATPSTAPRA